MMKEKKQRLSNGFDEEEGEELRRGRRRNSTFDLGCMGMKTVEEEEEESG